MAMKKTAATRTIDDYLSRVPEDKRAALEKVRSVIRKAAPKATECISYGIPCLKVEGHPLVGFGAAKAHCAFYLMSAALMEGHAKALEKYETSKGTIRFDAAQPLPATLVSRLVKARLAEVKERFGEGL